MIIIVSSSVLPLVPFFYSSSFILMAKVPDKERNKLSVALPVLGEVLCGQVTPFLWKKWDVDND